MQTRFFLGLLLMVALGVGGCGSPAQWQFKLESENGKAVLTMDGATVVFDDIALPAPHFDVPNASGQLTINGPDFVKNMSLVDGNPLTRSYADGVCTVTFHSHTLRIMDQGSAIEVDGTMFDVSEKAKTIIVGGNGEAKELQDPAVAQQ